MEKSHHCSLSAVVFKRPPILAMAVLLLLSATALQAQIRYGAAFLRNLPGARPQALAGSVAGVLDEPNTMWLNPGSAGVLREWQWSATYAKGLADTYSAMAFYGRRLKLPWSPWSRFALGLAYQGMPDFDSSAGAATAAGAHDVLAALSYGQPVRLFDQSFSLGANVKYLYSELASYSADSWMVDLGLLYRTSRFRLLGTDSGFLEHGIFSAGVSLSNLGNALNFIAIDSPLPKTLRAGVAFNAGSHHGLQLQLASDYVKVSDEKSTISFGTEISYGQIIALRGGYDFEDRFLNQFTFGLSLRLDDRNFPGGEIFPGRNNAMRVDLAAIEDNVFFSRPYRGTLVHQPIQPEQFQPVAGAEAVITDGDSVRLAWTEAREADLYDEVNYWLLVDRDSLLLAQTLERLMQEPSAFRSTLEPMAFLHSRQLTATSSLLTELDGGHYYWTILAYDLDNHVRVANDGNRRVWHFFVPMPDLQIIALEFDYSPLITEDEYQGELRVIVANLGDRQAGPATLRLYQDAAATDHDTSATNHHPPLLAQVDVAPLPAGGLDTLEIAWHTANAGRHEITAVIDDDNLLLESDEVNNSRAAWFYTIPKGSFGIGDTVAAITRMRRAFEVPFIPAVCFDSLSSEVPDSYLNHWYFEPPLVTLANRLQQHRDLKINLQGFADPNSGERTEAIAAARALAVRDSLVALGVSSEQIAILPAQVLPERRKPADATDANWVMQERRYVDITAAGTGQAIIFQLVTFDDYEQASTEVAFAAAIAGVTPLVNGAIKLSAPGLAEEIGLTSMLARPALRGNVPWRSEASPSWIEKTVNYTLVLEDSLGRQFHTLERHTFLTARTVLTEQTVALPIRFKGTAPLYDFYWDRILDQINARMQDPLTRIRFSGHACAIGSEPINQRYSERRVTAFVKEFEERIRRENPALYDQIKSRIDPPVGAGELHPLTIDRHYGDPVVIGDNELPLGRMLNRRLEIKFYTSKADLLSAQFGK